MSGATEYLPSFDSAALKQTLQDPAALLSILGAITPNYETASGRVLQPGTAISQLGQVYDQGRRQYLQNKATQQAATMMRPPQSLSPELQEDPEVQARMGSQGIVQPTAMGRARQLAGYSPTSLSEFLAQIKDPQMLQAVMHGGVGGSIFSRGGEFLPLFQEMRKSSVAKVDEERGYVLKQLNEQLRADPFNKEIQDTMLMLMQPNDAVNQGRVYTQQLEQVKALTSLGEDQQTARNSVLAGEAPQRMQYYFTQARQAENAKKTLDDLVAQKRLRPETAAMLMAYASRGVMPDQAVVMSDTSALEYLAVAKDHFAAFKMLHSSRPLSDEAMQNLVSDPRAAKFLPKIQEMQQHAVEYQTAEADRKLRLGYEQRRVEAEERRGGLQEREFKANQAHREFVESSNAVAQAATVATKFATDLNALRQRYAATTDPAQRAQLETTMNAVQRQMNQANARFQLMQVQDDLKHRPLVLLQGDKNEIEMNLDVIRTGPEPVQKKVETLNALMVELGRNSSYLNQITGGPATIENLRKQIMDVWHDVVNSSQTPGGQQSGSMAPQPFFGIQDLSKGPNAPVEPLFQAPSPPPPLDPRVIARAQELGLGKVRNDPMRQRAILMQAYREVFGQDMPSAGGPPPPQPVTPPPMPQMPYPTQPPQLFNRWSP